MTAEDLADLLRHRREAVNLTRAEAAAMVGRTPKAIAAMEQGLNLTSATFVFAYLELLGCDLIVKPKRLAIIPVKRA